MKRRTLIAAAIVVGAAYLMIVDVSTPSARLCAAEPQSFSEDILPILKGRCVSCHQPGGAGYEKSGLDLTTYEGLMTGTKFGAMVIARDPESSNLMWLLDWRASPADRMAHGKQKQSICDRNASRAWIRECAKTIESATVSTNGQGVAVASTTASSDGRPSCGFAHSGNLREVQDVPAYPDPYRRIRVVEESRRPWDWTGKSS